MSDVDKSKAPRKESKEELMKRLFLTKEESERQRREHPSRLEYMFIIGIDKETGKVVCR